MPHPSLRRALTCINNEERFLRVQAKLAEMGIGEGEGKEIQYINNYEFYRVYEDFHFDKVLSNLSEAIEPYLEQKSEVRLWGHVDWSPQEGIQGKLHTYECECDITIAELGFLTVCAYPAATVPAAVQLEMMRTHEYLMTDQELTLSGLYRKNKKSSWGSSFPSLSAQSELEDEMDLYKQKLDFVHVVSHEVRNPLTVIKAYATLLQDRTGHSADRDKLRSICDYVDLIDNEISHIIMTEQMLSTEALWRRKLITPKPHLTEVIEMMKIKGRTQNITVEDRLQLAGTEMILSNAIGFKLIVSNLVSNAIKYSDEGASVQVAASCTGGMLEIVVEDAGAGMSEEQVKRLFRKYEKMNEEKSGQGIGLFMVHKLLEHFEGSIRMESWLNEGTRAYVCLPLHSSGNVQGLCEVEYERA